MELDKPTFFSTEYLCSVMRDTIDGYSLDNTDCREASLDCSSTGCNEGPDQDGCDSTECHEMQNPEENPDSELHVPGMCPVKCPACHGQLERIAYDNLVDGVDFVDRCVYQYHNKQVYDERMRPPVQDLHALAGRECPSRKFAYK